MVFCPGFNKARLVLMVLIAALIGIAAPGSAQGGRSAVIADASRVHKEGPPPWAPAHGYRRKHPSGVDLIYDRVLDAYRVDGHPGCWFHDARFFCRRQDGWHSSAKIGGPWAGLRAEDLPPGLAHHHHDKQKHKRKKLQKHRKNHPLHSVPGERAQGATP